MRTPLQVQRLSDCVTAPWNEVSLVAQTASTNTDLAVAVSNGSAAPWHVLVTEHQSAGRGRLGRTWTSVPGATLTCSALVPTPTHPGWTPLIAGLAVAQAIEERYAVRPALKWPNDLLGPADREKGSEFASVGGKLAGILCEMTPKGVIVGIGLNVDQDRSELPVETATSLRLVAGGHPAGLTRESLLGSILSALADLLQGWPERGEEVRDAYRRRCATIGREVILDLGGERREQVRAVGVDDSGHLVVDLDGVRRSLAAGDVTHVR